MDQNGLDDLLREAREEEFKIVQEKTFRRLRYVIAAWILLIVLPFSIFFLLKGSWGKAIVIDILILQFIAIPLLSFLLSAVIGIIPFNSYLYRKRVHISFLYLVLALSALLFLSLLIAI